MAQQDQIKRTIELGVSQVNMNTRDMGLALAALAQENARARVAASAPTALTDSSSGTSAATVLAAVVNPTVAVKDGVATLADKAGFDTATAAIQNAHGELAAKVTALITLIGGSNARDLAAVGGGAANGTIEAIALLSGDTTNNLDTTTGLAELVKARNNQAAIAAAINYCRVAMGLSTLDDNSGGVFSVNTTEYSVDARAVSGAAATVNGTNTFTLASTNAAITVLRNNIATMAAQVNEMRGTVAIGPFVVATNNPRTRFLPAVAEIV